MKRRLLFLTALLAAVPVTALAQTTSDFAYRVGVTVSNATGSALTAAPVAVSMNAANLVSAGIMQADGEDALAANAGGTATPFLVQDVDQNGATWWLEVDSLNDASEGMWFFHMGDPDATRDQAFAFYGNDSITATDHADLDIADELTLEANGVTLDSVPASETWLLDKPVAYRLGVRNGNEVVARVSSDTLDVTDSTANGNDGTTTGGTLTTGQLNGAADLTDSGDRVTAAADPTINDIWNDGGTLEYWVFVPSASASGFIVAKRPAVGSEGWQMMLSGVSGTDMRLRFIRFFDTTNGSWDTTNHVIPEATWTHVAIVYNDNATSNDPVIYINGASVAITENTTPAGSRTSDAAYDLSMAADTAGSNDAPIYLDDVRLWDDERTAQEVDDNHDSELTGSETDLNGYWKLNAESAEVSHSPISAATEYDFKVTYDGSTLRLSVDGTEEATTATALTIFASAADLTIGAGIEGRVAQVRVGTTDVANPTYVLQYDFEPDELAQTDAGDAGDGWTWEGTVEDTSAGGSDHDGAYTLTRDQSDLTVTVGAVQIKDLPDFVLGEEDLPDVVGPTSSTGFLQKCSPGPDFPLRDTLESVATNAGIPTDGFWLFVTGVVGSFLGVLGALAFRNAVAGVFVLLATVWVGAPTCLYAPWVPLLITGAVGGLTGLIALALRG